MFTYLIGAIIILSSCNNANTNKETPQKTIKKGSITNDQLKAIEKFIENSPEEILDVVVEMAERLNNTWFSDQYDDILQDRFWQIYKRDSHFIKMDSNGKPLHGIIKGRIGQKFLRNNSYILE
jgi:hypothetical protein